MHHLENVGMFNNRLLEMLLLGSQFTRHRHSCNSLLYCSVNSALAAASSHITTTFCSFRFIMFACLLASVASRAVGLRFQVCMLSIVVLCVVASLGYNIFILKFLFGTGFVDLGAGWHFGSGSPFD